MTEREIPPYEPVDWERMRAAIAEQRAFEEDAGYYDPIRPRGGLVPLLKKLAAPLVFLGLLVWKL